MAGVYFFYHTCIIMCVYNYYYMYKICNTDFIMFPRIILYNVIYIYIYKDNACARNQIKGNPHCYELTSVLEVGLDLRD